MLSETERRRLSAALGEAERHCVPVPPLSGTSPAIDLDDAYAIQRMGVERRMADGARLVGHKIGLTSRAMQEQLNVAEPDYGHLLADMFVLEGMTIPTSELCAPRVEPEVAFVLKHELTGPGLTVADVLRATDFLLPALEVIDSRIADWQITLPDTVADNASSARVVLGGTPVAIDKLDPHLIGTVVWKNGKVEETGVSGAVLGNPVSAVCWLANKLAKFETGLNAGDVVMPGSCTRAIPIGPGDHVRAEFDGLGFVSADFSSI